jgi:ribosomal protein L40E
MNDPIHSEAEPERQLCISCVAPNDPAAHFCVKCGAPLTSYAATAPFEHLFAEGHVYRQAAERPQRLIVVLGIWLIFGGLALTGIGLLVMSRELGANT